MEKYLFYSIIGKHGGETIREILNRKQNEIELCNFSLWSACIDEKSQKLVWELNKSDKVVVYCKISKGAKDPTDISNIYHAQKMITPNGEVTIPNGIDTTYTKRNKKYRAYVVTKYDIFENTIDIDFGKYETQKKNDDIVSFKDRSKCGQFQNIFSRENTLLKETCIKHQIGAKFELSYPFVVELK
jgi:hypothetical protein